MKKYISLFISIILFIACSDSHDEVKPNPPSGEVIDTPTNLKDGITILADDSLGFALFAPGKKEVHLIGDFNNWTSSDEYKMHKDGDRFWIRIGKLQKDKEYICQYLIDNSIRIADPYASKISDPINDKEISKNIYPTILPYPTGKTSEIAMVVTTSKNNYPWQNNNFKLKNPDNMVIYELLVRDFTEERSIKAVKEKLSYLKNLGINAIELMPFNEFEANNSWGYNPSFYFAADKAYGTEKDYKNFIDACHQNGIAVIMDMVLNHAYGQCPLVRMYQNGDKAAADNPWFNVSSPNTSYSWGYDFNHESKYTQQFVDSVCSYWMSEYKVDGFRFDFTKGFTNKSGDGWAYDASRIAILKRMTNEIKKRNTDALVIFEHLADNKEEKELAEHGIYLWGNMNYNYNEATMGYGEEKENNDFKGDVSWSSYTSRGWNSPKLVSYMESHDEERIMFKNKAYGKQEGSYNVTNLTTALNRTEAAAVIQMTIPGPKMIWQFGELGYDYELNDDRLAPKPVKWDYFDITERKALYNVYSQMNNLRNTNPVFSTKDFSFDLKGNYKQILLKGDKPVCAIANFDVKNKTGKVSFGKTGKWQDVFTNQTLNVTSSELEIELAAGEYRLYIAQ